MFKPASHGPQRLKLAAGSKLNLEEQVARLVILEAIYRLVAEDRAYSARLESGALKVELPSRALFILSETGVERLG